MLTLYGRFPTRSNRVHWALEELEVPYTFYQVDFAAGDTDSPAFRSLNPGGKIPVLTDGDLVLTESGAICNYLGDRHPASGLAPSPGSPDRARYDQWMFFAQSELEQPLWTKAKHKFVLPKEWRVKGLEDTVAWEFQRAAEVLTKGLGDNEFIVGDRFTMADIMLTHTLGWAKAANMEIRQRNLLDYANRNFGRPAVNRMAKCRGQPLPGGREIH
ncbi:MAG: glutathione S-transferase family protein [Gammaproteobacteria bacterium]|nr:glutathione S-transferase family protein [Gammaproteobacteria bacterium]